MEGGLTPLCLPPAPLKFKRAASGRMSVFCPLRRRYVCLTPEEWVRQNFVHFLVSHRGFPAARMANETAIRLGRVCKRCDTVAYDSHARPLVIVEYKAPHITLSQATLDQIMRYNMALRVPWLILSNGLRHHCIAVDYDRGECRFLNDIPLWSEISAPVT